MENMFKKESPKFDGTNYDSQKDKMKTHLLCMGQGYWLVIYVQHKGKRSNIFNSTLK